MIYYRHTTQAALDKLDAERAAMSPDIYAAGRGMILGNDHLAYVTAVEIAMGRARNFYWTYRPARSLVRDAYTAGRKPEAVASELLDIRRKQIGDQRRWTREQNKQFGR